MTVIHPSTTALDARNAAQVMAHTGHARGEFVDRSSGGACLAGAINLATTDRLEGPYVIGRMQLGWREVIHPCKDGDWDARIDRQQAVMGTLIPFLPDRCDGTHPDPCAFYGETIVEEARIPHYNDYVCTGGEEAIGLLIQVAEKIEADL